MNLIVEIAEIADQDLEEEEIFDYTLSMHGIDQAEQYVSSFDVLFSGLAQHPKLGRERNEIRKGLRSVIKEFHVAFYRILEDRIRIVRIIHTSRNLRLQKL